MKKTILTLLFIIIFLNLYSQNNFRKRYIIKNNNDTVLGLNDYRNDQINIIKKHNKAVSSNCEIFEKTEPRIIFKVGVGTGFNISLISHNGFTNHNNYTIYSTESNFSPSYAALLMLNSNLVLPRFSKKISLQFDILFMKHYYTSYSQIGLYNTDFYVNAYYLKNPILIKYTFQKWKFKPFINAGINNTFLVRSNYLLFQSQNIANNVFYFNKITDLEFSTYQLSISAGVGFDVDFLKRNSLFIEFRYEYGKSFMSGNINNFTVFTGITF